MFLIPGCVPMPLNHTHPQANPWSIDSVARARDYWLTESILQGFYFSVPHASENEGGGLRAEGTHR